MSEKFFRIYKKLDAGEIKKHLMIYGDLGGTCASCNAIDLKLDMVQCPQCVAAIKYISFRNIKVHMPKVQRLSQERPGLVFVDFEDYQRNIGASKAEEFFKD